MGKLMQEFLEKDKALELSKEIEVTALETNLNINAATRLVVEQYKKAHSSTDQSKSYKHLKDFNEIISNIDYIGNRDRGGLENGRKKNVCKNNNR